MSNQSNCNYSFQYQETSKGLPILNKYRDPKWGPNIYDMIEASRITKIRIVADDALRELNSLQRSAQAYEEHSRATPIGSPRDFKISLMRNGDFFKRSKGRLSSQSFSGRISKSSMDSPRSDSSFNRTNQLRPLVNIPKTHARNESGSGTVDGNPSGTKLSDMNHPTKIGEKFDGLYQEEWSDAVDALTKQLGYNEENSVYVLLRIVRYAYDFCKRLAESQLHSLCGVMESQILNPQSNNKSISQSETVPPTLDHTRRRLLKTVSIKYSKDYRRATALASIPEVIEIFKGEVLNSKLSLDPGQLPQPLIAYVDLCVEITWLMCVQDPPMVITWAVKGETINTDYYNFYKKKGIVVKEAVWPVLFLHHGGQMVCKGVVLPE
ncbi:hypothetical protein FSP39_012510 [Pinctada imbricata]|uniref:Mitochondria-eating protein C-terminal domain-containing protein n=1 Tax=Pinctada imbricata TaxID=66713 RepID=A0AA88Y798_PINIB|nr:hypothetical protein FSP39_012510 [Pinctada imbricata]